MVERVLEIPAHGLLPVGTVEPLALPRRNLPLGRDVLGMLQRGAGRVGRRVAVGEALSEYLILDHILRPIRDVIGR